MTFNYFEESIAMEIIVNKNVFCGTNHDLARCTANFPPPSSALTKSMASDASMQERAYTSENPKSRGRVTRTANLLENMIMHMQNGFYQATYTFGPCGAGKSLGDGLIYQLMRRVAASNPDFPTHWADANIDTLLSSRNPLHWNDR